MVLNTIDLSKDLTDNELKTMIHMTLNERCKENIIGPSRATGGSTILTREPSESLASIIGLVWFTIRLDLNVLSSYIPKDERIITIEDSAELQIQGIPNLVRLEVRNAN